MSITNTANTSYTAVHYQEDGIRVISNNLHIAGLYADGQFVSKNYTFTSTEGVTFTVMENGPVVTVVANPFVLTSVTGSSAAIGSLNISAAPTSAASTVFYVSTIPYLFAIGATGAISIVPVSGSFTVTSLATTSEIACVFTRTFNG